MLDNISVVAFSSLSSLNVIDAIIWYYLWILDISVYDGVVHTPLSQIFGPLSFLILSQNVSSFSYLRYN